MINIFADCVALLKTSLWFCHNSANEESCNDNLLFSYESKIISYYSPFCADLALKSFCGFVNLEV